MPTVAGAAQQADSPAQAGSVELVWCGPTAVSVQDLLKPEVILRQGYPADAAVLAAGPWAVFADATSVATALSWTVAAAVLAGPPVHIFLCPRAAGPPGELTGVLADLGWSCPVTSLLVADQLEARGIAGAAALTCQPTGWQEFTVRLIPSAGGFPQTLDAFAARVIKEELRVWPA